MCLLVKAHVHFWGSVETTQGPGMYVPGFADAAEQRCPGLLVHGPAPFSLSSLVPFGPGSLGGAVPSGLELCRPAN